MPVGSVEEQAILVNRSLSGDQDAFGELVNRYRNLVYGFLLNRIGDFEEAEDLTQEAFVEAYIHLGTLREPGKFSSWLCGITRNLCNEHLKRHRRESEVLGQLVPQEEIGRSRGFPDGTEPPTPEDEYASQEMKEAIWQAIGQLPEKSREALLLFYFNEMSYGEIAEFLGIAPGTVRSHLRHGRDKLKAKMLPLAKEVIDEKRLPRTFTRKVISALPLIPPRAPKPKSTPPLGRWILSLKSKLLGMGLLALTAGLIGLFALGRGEKHPPEVMFPMFPTMRVRLATPDEMEQVAEHLEEEEETEMMTSRRSKLMTGVLGVVMALAGTTATEAMAQGSWTQKADIPTARPYPGAAVVDGKIYVIGGGFGQLEICAVVEEYDPAADTWTRRADMPTARHGLGAAAVDGIIYAIGGWSAGGQSSIVEAYDPAVDTWTKKATMPTRRDGMSAVAVDGKIYVIGGLLFPSSLSTVEVYDPATDTWTKKASMPTARFDYAACVVDGRIYVSGGVPGWPRSSPTLSTVEVYDPATDTWTQASDMPWPRYAHSASVVAGKMYLIGGQEAAMVKLYNEGKIEEDKLEELFSPVDVYDPGTDTWTTAADFPAPRGFLTANVVDGKIYAIGGMRREDEAFSTVDEFDPGVPTTSIEALFWGALKGMFR